MERIFRMILSYDEWRKDLFRNICKSDRQKSNILVRTEESILQDLEYTFGSKELALKELNDILQQEYKLYIGSVA